MRGRLRTGSGQAATSRQSKPSAPAVAESEAHRMLAKRGGGAHRTHIGAASAGRVGVELPMVQNRSE